MTRRGVRAAALTAFIDGGSRGNPGPAAAAALMHDGGRCISRLGAYLGVATNNQAEYLALLLALDEARRAGATRLEVFTDSELLARQWQGVYRVKNAGLQKMQARAAEMAGSIGEVVVSHIPREENREADALVNRILDWAETYIR